MTVYKPDSRGRPRSSGAPKFEGRVVWGWGKSLSMRIGIRTL
jgi:hypothetical protein